MYSFMAPEIPAPGFSFENCKRNAFLLQNGYPAPKATKTGTTIVGIIYEDGVILGADTRATEDKLVSDKNCTKIHYLAPNIYCCGAGTAADTEMSTQTVSSQLELLRLHSGCTVPVVSAATLLKRMLFRYRGFISAALILGGIDREGPHVYSIYPHGSSTKLPYATLGSGSLAAMAVFEASWKPNMSEEDGKELVRKAVSAGILNDLGSGSNVDLCLIRNTGTVENIRAYEAANFKGEKQGSYKYPLGTTAVLRARVIPLQVEATLVRPVTRDTTPTTSR
ncbi:proteasome subunit domain-containing protein [Phthorimaea operculella]|nr:proteasome subunit domain-containing protein [Phthorimaea operculella]